MSDYDQYFMGEGGDAPPVQEAPVGSSAAGYDFNGDAAPQVDTPTQTPGYNPNYNYDAALTEGLALIEPLNNAAILNFDTPGVAVGLDAANQARAEPGIGSKLWDSTKDILGAKGDSVGAMLLAMALKGIGSMGPQKTANALASRRLDIEQGTLNLAQQKEQNLQNSRTGNFTVASMQPNKVKPFAPLSGTGMINTGRV